MTFAEVIEGLKNGQNFTRINSPVLNGKFITMQIPADIPTDVIPKMAPNTLQAQQTKHLSITDIGRNNYDTTRILQNPRKIWNTTASPNFS